MIFQFFLKTGEKFYLKNSDKFALLNGDGKLEYDGEILDMHGLCAKLKGVKASRLNGFLWWQAIRNDKKVTIDEIRASYRNQFV